MAAAPGQRPCPGSGLFAGHDHMAGCGAADGRGSASGQLGCHGRESQPEAGMAEWISARPRASLSWLLLPWPPLPGSWAARTRALRSSRYLLTRRWLPGWLWPARKPRARVPFAPIVPFPRAPSARPPGVLAACDAVSAGERGTGGTAGLTSERGLRMPGRCWRQRHRSSNRRMLSLLCEVWRQVSRNPARRQHPARIRPARQDRG